jgi:hypothetical protein
MINDVILVMDLIKMYMFLVTSNRGLNNLSVIDVPHIVIISAIVCVLSGMGIGHFIHCAQHYICRANRKWKIDFNPC